MKSFAAICIIAMVLVCLSEGREIRNAKKSAEKRKSCSNDVAETNDNEVRIESETAEQTDEKRELVAEGDCKYMGATIKNGKSRKTGRMTIVCVNGRKEYII